MANYWFKSLASGAKVTAATVQDISRLAQREADKFGQAVQIYTGADGRKSHRRLSMARNPTDVYKLATARAIVKKGRDAALAGKPRSSNPYTEPRRMASWFKGWDKVGYEDDD